MTEAQLRQHLAYEGYTDDEVEAIVDDYIDHKVQQDKEEKCSTSTTS